MNVAKWLSQLFKDCPVFGEVVTTPSVGPIRTVVPGKGWKLDVRHAVINTYAPGLSLNHLRMGMGAANITALHERLNSTQVKIASVFDLLVVQGDRHGENVHVKENGNLHLIDNLDKSFMYPNSLFLAQTYISERIYTGNGGIVHPLTGKLASYSDGSLSRSSWPRLRLDYRCHTAGRGEDQLPKPLVQCLRKLAKYGTTGIARRYNMPAPIAGPFHSRIDMLLKRGFKRTLASVLRLKPQHEKTDKDGNIIVEFSIQPTAHKDRLEFQTYPKRPACCKLIFAPEPECDPPIDVNLPVLAQRSRVGQRGSAGSI